MQDFNGKVAVITGGASGVGRSLAFSLGRLGAKIVVGDVDQSAMAATPETDQKIRARAEMILNRETPVADMVGA